MNFREKTADFLLDCGKLAFGVAIASDIFKGYGGEINFLLALGGALILYLLGSLMFILSKQGGRK